MCINKWIETICLFITIAQCNEKKSSKAIKQELLAPVTKIADEDYSGLNEDVKNAKEPKEVIFIIKKHEELLQGEDRKIINIVGM